jgi:hypothetical protein
MDNGKDMVQRDEFGRLLPGSKLSPGRPKGSKSKFSKDLINSYAQMAANGEFEEVMQRLKDDNPTAWAKLVNDAAMKLLDREEAGIGGVCEECGGPITPKTILQVEFVEPPEYPPLPEVTG